MKINDKKKPRRTNPVLQQLQPGPGLFHHLVQCHKPLAQPWRALWQRRELVPAWREESKEMLKKNKSKKTK